MTAPKKRTSRRSPKRKSGKQKKSFRSHWVSLLFLGGLFAAAVYVAVLYYFFVSPLSFRWRALYGEPDFPTGYDIMGIDVSHHQDRIDWERLRNAKVNGCPIRFVVIKATEGANHFDDHFNDNFHHAKESGLIRGAYHYYKPNKSADSQSEFFLRQVHLLEGDLPPILDIEERGDKPLEDFRADVLRWLDAVERACGTPPIIYTGYRFKLDFLSGDEFDRYPLWIAHYYKKELEYKGNWLMWQYTDCGKVDGIRGFVDLNIFNGEMKDLVKKTLPAS